MELIKKRLIELYSYSSKHSNYQKLPERLNEILKINFVNSRYEPERLKYILQNVEIADKIVLDIGGNTGYFSFAMLDNGAKMLHYYEGNPVHAEFVKLSSELLMIENRIQITQGYFLFDVPLEVQYDVILLLNVLHHVGDDYGDQKKKFRFNMQKS